MKIFIDTNIFYNNWFLNYADFKYLFHFLNNEGHELILSKVVIEEVNNAHSRELKSEISLFKKRVKKLYSLSPPSASVELKELVGNKRYSFEKIIGNRVNTFKILDYSSIPHEIIVNKALNNKKPFLKGEKGYRDSLIWLSLLEYLEKNNISDEVAFISKNKTDFYSSEGKKVVFHSDLIADIKQLNTEVSITPYLSLYDFVRDTIDTNQHAFNHEELEESISSYIEEEGIEYINVMTNKEINNYFKSSSLSIFHMPSVIDISAFVVEGIEDLYVDKIEYLQKGHYFVSCSYNLRIVELIIEVYKDDFLPVKDKVDMYFYEAQVIGDTVTLRCFVRLYYDVSLIYDENNDICDDFSVANLEIKF